MVAVPSAEVMALIKQGYSYEHATHYTANPDIGRRNEKAYAKFVRSNNRVLQNMRRESRRAAREMVSRNDDTGLLVESATLRNPPNAIDYSKGSDA